MTQAKAFWSWIRFNVSTVKRKDQVNFKNLSSVEFWEKLITGCFWQMLSAPSLVTALAISHNTFTDFIHMGCKRTTLDAHHQPKCPSVTDWGVWYHCGQTSKSLFLFFYCWDFIYQLEKNGQRCINQIVNKTIFPFFSKFWAYFAENASR